MPKKTKDEEVKKVTKRTTKKADVVEVEKMSTSIKKSSSASIAKKSATDKTTTTKKASSTSKKSPASKTSANKSTTTSKKSTTSKNLASKSTTTSKKSTTSKNLASKSTTTSKKSPASKTSASKSTTTSKKTTSAKSRIKKASTQKAKPISTMEYYDLPTAYNRTIVKILAQTPSSLFVYWEISEDDRIKLKSQYGDDFFQNTKPYLVIFNETMDYHFETEINDYANSWYVHIYDSSCQYNVQLIRKPIVNTPTAAIANSFSIISSNEIAAPNDHILFDRLGKTVFFKDIKSNRVIKKDISSLSFISNIGRIYNIYDLYKVIYKNELNGDELGMNLTSSGFSSTFR